MDIVVITGIIVNVLLAIVGFFIVKWIKSVEKKQEEADKEMKEIKSNYLHRFEEIKENLNDKHLAVIDAIHKLEILITKHH